MKRDMDLVRELLKWAEDAAPNAERWSEQFARDHSVDHSVVTEHIRLLTEANLVDAYLMDANGDIFAARIDRLTWDGHEFLSGARNDTIWNKAKSLARDKRVELTLEIAKWLLPGISKALLGDGSGQPGT